MAKECCVHFFKYGSSLHTSNAVVFITFNIKIYNISNNKMKKSNFMRVSHASLFKHFTKQWTVGQNV